MDHPTIAGGLLTVGAIGAALWHDRHIVRRLARGVAAFTRPIRPAPEPARHRHEVARMSRTLAPEQLQRHGLGDELFAALDGLPEPERSPRTLPELAAGAPLEPWPQLPGVDQSRLPGVRS